MHTKGVGEGTKLTGAPGAEQELVPEKRNRLTFWTMNSAVFRFASMIRVFIGFDPVETVSFHTLSHSIQARSSVPVSITPLMLCQLQDVLTRERHLL